MKQKIVAGKEIDVVTPEELAEVFTRPFERVIYTLGGADSVEEVHDDIPTKGTRSIATAFQRGAGSDNLVIQAATFTEVCSFRPGRLAGTVQNIGSNPAFTYLAPLTYVRRLAASPAGPVPTINGVIVGFLAAGTGVFDFKLTNEVWGGPVTVWSLLGTTLVWGEH